MAQAIGGMVGGPSGAEQGVQQPPTPNPMLAVHPAFQLQQDKLQADQMAKQISQGIAQQKVQNYAEKLAQDKELLASRKFLNTARAEWNSNYRPAIEKMNAVTRRINSQTMQGNLANARQRTEIYRSDMQSLRDYRVKINPVWDAVNTSHRKYLDMDTDFSETISKAQKELAVINASGLADKLDTSEGQQYLARKGQLMGEIAGAQAAQAALRSDEDFISVMGGLDPKDPNGQRRTGGLYQQIAPTIGRYPTASSQEVNQTGRAVNPKLPRMGPALPGMSPGVMPRVKTVDEAKRLKPGTHFLDPSGIERVR